MHTNIFDPIKTTENVLIMTTGVDEPRIINDIVDQQLNQDCLVVIEDCFKPTSTEMGQSHHTEVRVVDCFKSPLPKPEQAPAVKWKITKRRQSLRLQDKIIPSMKEDAIKIIKKHKKKPKNTYLDDIKKSNSIVLSKGDESSDTANSHQIISNQYPELSDSDILELVYQMTSFIEKGVFDDANMNWNDSTSETDLTLLCPQQISEPMPLIPPVTNATDTSNEVFVLDSSGALDLSINIRNSSSENCFPVSNPQAFHENASCKASYSPSVTTQTTFDDKYCHNEAALKSISTQTTSVHRASTSTQTTLEDCSKDETVLRDSISTQTSSIIKTSTSTQTTFVEESFKDETVTSTTNNLQQQMKKISASKTTARVDTSSQPNDFLVKSRGCDRDSKSLKRRNSKSETKPCQNFIQNYDMKNFAVNRKVFKFKIPKLRKQETDDSSSEELPVLNIKEKISGKSFQTASTQTNVGTPQVPRFLSPRNNFDLMKKRVVKVLGEPCHKFLQNEECGLHCKYNHVLPSAANVAEIIKDWSNELIHFLYTTYIQRYLMCYIMYFPAICNIYVERRLPDNIIATVKDCERFLVDDNFKLLLLALMRCGFGHDDALFTICTHANRTTSINKILEIITVFRVRNFKQTIAFLCTEIESYEFDSSFANEVLRQACDDGMDDEILLEFCYAIIRKCNTNNTLNTEYMKMLYMKM